MNKIIEDAKSTMEKLVHVHGSDRCNLDNLILYAEKLEEQAELGKMIQWAIDRRLIIDKLDIVDLEKLYKSRNQVTKDTPIGTEVSKKEKNGYKFLGRAKEGINLFAVGHYSDSGEYIETHYCYLEDLKLEEKE